MTLLEREGELAALRALVADSAAGAGGLVLIEGPGGIGKSGLLAGLREEAAGRLSVLAARASELEREFAFGVVRQLFEAAVAAAPVTALAGGAAPAAAVFAAAPAPQGEGSASFAALHGLYWLTLNLAAEQPLLLAVDDLHWCDRPSLRFLAYLTRRLEGVGVLVAATLRSNEPGADPALLADIAHDPASHVLQPGPLGAAGVAALVRERLGAVAETAFCDACHDATGGNPLLLRQLLRTLEAEGVPPEAAHLDEVRLVGPRAVASTVLLRLARLSPDARAVARAVSVLEPSAELPLVARLAGVAEAAVGDGAAALVRAEILRPEPPLGFVHRLVRDAVYHELAPGERELQHERAAQALRAAGADAEHVAAQLLAAPRRGEPWVVDLLGEAAAAAMGRAAADSAAAYLRRALEEPPPRDREADVLLALGAAEALTNGPAAADALRRAYAATRDPVTRAHIALSLVLALMFTDRASEGAAVAQEAGAALSGAELADLRRRLEALEIGAAFFGADGSERRARLARHRAAPAPGEPGAAGLAALAAVEWSYAGGAAGDCVTLALAAIQGGALFAEDNGPIAFGATVAMILADRDEAVALLEGALADARRRGSMFSVSAAHSWLGFSRLRRGDLTGADALLREAAELTATWGVSRAASVIHAAFLAEARLERGDVAGARAELDRGRDPGDDSDSARWFALSRQRVLLAEGRSEEALAAGREIGTRFAWVSNPAASGWRGTAAEALARLGRNAEALDLAAEELELARRWGAPGALGRALRRVGELRGADGLAQLEEAVAVLDGSPARLEHARALATLGAALRRERRPSDAREPLRRALELAAACDATALAEHVRTELYASGARPRGDALAGAAALTASERRVADLAAAGQTNRDIAQVLFVTPKTVEVHLSNAYRKLGIRSRRELTGALA